MKDSFRKELQSRVEAFATEVTSILQRAVADSMGGTLSEEPGGRARGNAPSRAPAKAARAAKSTRSAKKSSKRASGREKTRSAGDIDATAKALLVEVKKKSGQRMEQLSKKLRKSSKRLALPMKKLLSEKKVKTSGQARGTTYRAA